MKEETIILQKIEGQYYKTTNAPPHRPQKITNNEAEKTKDKLPRETVQIIKGKEVITRSK